MTGPVLKTLVWRWEVGKVGERGEPIEGFTKGTRSAAACVGTTFGKKMCIRSEFIFINPNSKGQCGCGESFMTTGNPGAANYEQLLQEW
ncbi:hypothetical protein CK203_009604 [Vitis vinifera]|uniref:Uncharacterized protein n=1 Tax=Vitis vinifera TaxID=29760 RepID=A0A438JS11_VITVI|nr:hypothetical protein CK203_009604 [Vitis vinifera]